jgi:hypothetical protein
MTNPLPPSCTVPPPASVAIGTKKKLLALTSNVAPLPTVTLLELETSPKPDSASVPSLMVVAPVYAFAPDSVTVPAVVLLAPPVPASDAR